MASPKPHHQAEALESPRKRQKLSPPPSLPLTNNQAVNPATTTQAAPPSTDTTAKMEELPHTMVVGETGFNLEQEKHCGILHYANEWRPGFSGILKQRYASTPSHLPSLLLVSCLLYPMSSSNHSYFCLYCLSDCLRHNTSFRA